MVILIFHVRLNKNGRKNALQILVLSLPQSTKRSKLLNSRHQLVALNLNLLFRRACLRVPSRLSLARLPMRTDFKQWSGRART